MHFNCHWNLLYTCVEFKGMRRAPSWLLCNARCQQRRPHRLKSNWIPQDCEMLWMNTGPVQVHVSHPILRSYCSQNFAQINRRSHFTQKRRITKNKLCVQYFRNWVFGRFYVVVQFMSYGITPAEFVNTPAVTNDFKQRSLILWRRLARLCCLWVTRLSLTYLTIAGATKTSPSANAVRTSSKKVR